MTQAMVPDGKKTDTLQSFLGGDVVKSKLAAVAKGFMKPEDLIRCALVAVHRNPDLLRCTKASFLAALMDAAELRVRPGGMNGRGYLVPRKNKNTGALEVCFDPGWRGLIDIMRRTGEVKRIEAHPVFSNDRIRVVYGLNPVFEHEPCLDEDRGALVGAYALAEFKDGSFQVEPLTKADLVKIRNASTSRNSPAWSGWEEEMARKSAVRRLSKYMPAEPAMDKAASLAARTEPGGDADWHVDEPTDAELVSLTEPAQLPAARTESLKEKLKAKAEPEAVTREPGDDFEEDERHAAEIEAGRA